MPSQDRMTAHRRRRHIEMLLVCTFVLAAAPLLTVEGDERVAVSSIPGVVLPPLCMSRAWFGVSCPGCGLTRSFVHLAHGDWQASFQAHRLGWLLMAAAVLQVPYRLALLNGSRRFEWSSTASTACGTVLVALLVMNWLVLIIFG